MDLKGQKMLKVCSILMIIGGALLLLLSIIGLAGVVAAFAVATPEELGMSAGAAYGSMAVGIASAVIELVAGIVGVKAAKMPSVGKIKASLILGLLVAVLSLISSISGIVTSGFTGSAVAGLVLGLVVPVLYVVGVIQYKNALVELLGGAE